MMVNPAVRKVLKRTATLVEWLSQGSSVLDLSAALINRGEIFRYFYGLHKQELGASPVILDVGAANGRSAQAAHRIWPLATVHSFEPNESYLSELRILARDNPRWIVHPVALGSANGQAEFFVLGHAESSSLKKPSEQLGGDWGMDLGVQSSVVVEQRRLDDLGLGLDRIDILKVDVQGAETEMLEGARRTLEGVRHAIIECGFGESYANASRFSDITEAMERSGLFLADLINKVTGTNGRLLQCDLVFRNGRGL